MFYCELKKPQFHFLMPLQVIYALLFILEERNNCKSTIGISWKKILNNAIIM